MGYGEDLRPFAYVLSVGPMSTDSWNAGELCRFDLRSATIATWMDAHLDVDLGYQRGWIAALLNAGKDEERLFCSVALQRPISRGSHVDYMVALVGFDGSFEVVADLSHVFV